MSDIQGSAQRRAARHRHKVFELYDVYRSYLIHEDTLIGQRTQRMLLVQGALFTAAGAVLGRLFEAFGQPSPKNPPCPVHPRQAAVYAGCLLLLAVTGILAAFLSRGALKAAADAAAFLNDQWTRINQSWKDAGELSSRELHLPGLQGAGAPAVHDRGQLHVILMPAFLMALWAASMIGLGVAVWHFRGCL